LSLNGVIQTSDGKSLLTVAVDKLTGKIELWANGQQVSVGSSAARGMWPFEILPLQDTQNIIGATSGAVTAQLDQAVLFSGRPTLRIDVPAGLSGLVTVAGTNAATASVPTDWNLEDLCVALKATSINQVSAVYPYIGDATFANYWAKNQTKTTYAFPDSGFIESNKWAFFHVGDANGPTTIPVASGSPSLATRMRAKLSIILNASDSPQSIWIGFFGVLPKRKKPTIIMTMDDGYNTWWSFVAPLARYYDIPVSMGIIGTQVGQTGYMTADRIMSLFHDPSGLFDIVNHSYSHLYYDGSNAESCVSDYENNLSYLRSIGITGNGPKHVFYPGGASDMNLYRAMQSHGFLSGRKLHPCWVFGRDQTMTFSEDQGRYVLNVLSNMQNTATVAEVTGAIDGAVTRNECAVLMGHSWGASNSSLMWKYENLEGVFAYIANLRDSGQIECKSITRWYADLRGETCSRR